MSDTIAIGGWSKLSSCDWPGMLVTTVFCQGCPWQCAYCHNPELLSARTPSTVEWSTVIAHLERRRGLLDGVVFSGGEPLLQTGLPAALRAVRDLGYATGLHTAGAYPARLERILAAGLVDWVGFDVKAPLPLYDQVTGTTNSAVVAHRSLRAVVDSGVAHQFRTTVDPDLLGADDMTELDYWLCSLSGEVTVRQTARPVYNSPAT